MEEQEVELLESWVELGKAELRWGGREEAKPRPGVVRRELQYSH